MSPRTILEAFNNYWESYLEPQYLSNTDISVEDLELAREYHREAWNHCIDVVAAITKGENPDEV